jgi:hypothetical protein
VAPLDVSVLAEVPPFASLLVEAPAVSVLVAHPVVSVFEVPLFDSVFVNVPVFV